MDTLDRYLIREFLTYFVVILLSLALLFLGIDFLTKFWSFHLPIGKVLTIYGYKLPGALQQFVPVACLMATLLVVSSLSRQNELMALYASGVSNLRLISTFVAAVATVSTISFLSFDSIVPTLAKRQTLVSKGIDPDAATDTSTDFSGSFWYRSGRLLYNVGRFEPSLNLMKSVDVYLLSPQFQLLQRIHAQEARYINGDWILQDGYVITYPRENPFPQTYTFKTKGRIIPEKPGDFKTLKLDEETMRLRDLRKYIGRNRAFGLDTTAQQVHYQERLALVFTPLVFVLLGIPFALKPLKSQSMPKSIAFCFLVVFIYLIMFRMSLSIGKSGHIPPIMAGWTPNFVFMALAGLLILRKE